MIVCMKDRYGVPSNMFGVVPDDFYAIVGRVIMLATQVEYRVLALLWALDRQQPQDVHAGKPARELLKECRSRLHGHDQAIRDAGRGLLTRVQAALDERHAVAHSLWPSPGLDRAYGWRPIIEKRRTQGSWIASTETSEIELVTLIGTLVRLVEELKDFTDRLS